MVLPPTNLRMAPGAQLMPNVYAMSLDPIGLAYNTALMADAPTSIAGLAKIIAADPEKYQNKITTRDVNGAFGFTVSQAFAEGTGSAWDSLEKILPSARPETSSGTQLEKICPVNTWLGSRSAPRLAARRRRRAPDCLSSSTRPTERLSSAGASASHRRRRMRPPRNCSSTSCFSKPAGTPSPKVA